MAEQQGTKLALSTFAIYNSSIHILYGIYLFGISVSCILFSYPISIIGAGFWTGFLFLMEGLIGLYIKRKGEENCFLVTFLSISIISVITSAFIFIFSMLGIYCETNLRLDKGASNLIQNLTYLPEQIRNCHNCTTDIVRRDENRTLSYVLPKEKGDNGGIINPQHIYNSAHISLPRPLLAMTSYPKNSKKGIKDFIIIDLKYMIDNHNISNNGSRERKKDGLSNGYNRDSNNFNRLRKLRKRDRNITPPGAKIRTPKEEVEELGMSDYDSKDYSFKGETTSSKEVIEVKMLYTATVMIYVIAATLSTLEFLISILSTVICCKAAFSKQPATWTPVSNSDMVLVSKGGLKTINSTDYHIGRGLAADENKEISVGNQASEALVQQNLRKVISARKKFVGLTNIRSFGGGIPTTTHVSSNSSLHPQTLNHKNLSLNLREKSEIPNLMITSPVSENGIGRIKKISGCAGSNTKVGQVDMSPEAQDILSPDERMSWNHTKISTTTTSPPLIVPSSTYDFDEIENVHNKIKSWGLKEDADYDAPKIDINKKRSLLRARSFLNPFRMTLKYDPIFYPPSVYLDLPSMTELSSMNRTCSSYVFHNEPSNSCLPNGGEQIIAPLDGESMCGKDTKDRRGVIMDECYKDSNLHAANYELSEITVTTNETKNFN